MFKKGFTLIELLVVIAILTVLAVAVVLIINPAELIKQGRDSTRLSDLATVHSAISLYLADVSSPSFTSITTCTAGTAGSGACPSGSTITASTTVDGNGWVRVNFSNISSGAPLSRLPLDPSNGSSYFYVFKSTSASTTYELNATMESIKFANGGGSDVESDDGGDDDQLYEVGNDPSLDLL